MEKGKSVTEVTHYIKRSLELFSRGAVNSAFFSFFLLHWELFRMFMHLIKIGVYIDDFLFYVKGGTTEYLSHVTSAQARLLKTWPTMPHGTHLFPITHPHPQPNGSTPPSTVSTTTIYFSTFPNTHNTLGFLTVPRTLKKLQKLS